MPTIKSPPERIVETDMILTMYNRTKLGLSYSRRIAVLACGHRVITRNAKTMVCPRCTEMLRRSIADGSEDWDGFRNGNAIDRMEWPKDPCRSINERQ